MTQGKKKSTFITQDSVPDDHFIDTFGNGVNRKIPKGKFFDQIRRESGVYQVYATLEDLNDAKLIPNPDDEIYVVLADSGDNLYRITSLAAGDNDISLSNGATATFVKSLSVFPLSDITSLSSLNTAALVDGQQFDRREWWPGTGVGGSKEIWDPNMPVSMHNGGTIKDPAKISELNTTNKTFGTYFTPDTVSGNTGCFVVTSKTVDRFVNALTFGCLSGIDCTAPIDAMFAYIETIPALDLSPVNGERNILTMYNGAVMYFPSGQYKYSGTGYRFESERSLKILGDGPVASVITILSDTHLLREEDSPGGLLNYLELNSIKFQGGRGAFFSTKNDVNNVQYGRRVYNCGFIGYTSVAFGSFAKSDTRWIIQSSVFEGGDTGTPVGVLFPHEVADVDCSGNTFTGNKYQIIVTDAISEHNIGPNNTFFSIAIIGREADIWMVPSATNNLNGRGWGLVDCRFSNENANADPVFLIADRDGPISHVFNHSAAVSNGTFREFEIKGNKIARAGDSINFGNPGLIYSYAYKIGGIRASENAIRNLPYFLEFDPAVTDAQIDSGANHRNIFRVDGREESFNDPANIRACNRNGGGLLIDNTQSANGDPACISNGSDGLVGYSRIHPSNSLSGVLIGADVTRTAETDSQGGTDASLFRFATGSNQFILISSGAVTANFRPGHVAWVELDVKAPAATPLTAFRLEFKLSGVTTSKNIPVTSEWSRISLPLIWTRDYDTDGVSGGNWEIQVQPRGFFNAGVNDGVILGRRAIYHSPGPVPYSVVNV